MGRDPDSRRVQITVPADLKKRFDQIFRWGEWNGIGVQIIEWICEMHEKHGDAAFLVFRSGKLTEFLKKEVKDENL